MTEGGRSLHADISQLVHKLAVPFPDQIEEHSAIQLLMIWPRRAHNKHEPSGSHTQNNISSIDRIESFGKELSASDPKEIRKISFAQMEYKYKIHITYYKLRVDYMNEERKSVLYQNLYYIHFTTAESQPILHA